MMPNNLDIVIRKAISGIILVSTHDSLSANLGLQRAVVFLEANTGFENDILNYSKIHDYWVFQCSIFGRFDGCAGLWNIPIGEEDKFIEFF